MSIENCDLKTNTNINTNNVREYEDLDCSAQWTGIQLKVIFNYMYHLLGSMHWCSLSQYWLIPFSNVINNLSSLFKVGVRLSNKT